MSRRSVTLADGYIAEFDTIDKAGWHDLIRDFLDASIYQTWSYESIRHGDLRLSHLILKRGRETVAGAQARLIHTPGIGPAAAYVRWAPLWKRRGHPIDHENYLMSLRALRNEYTSRRGLVLRVLPFFPIDGPEPFLRILRAEGFKKAATGRCSRTLILDIGRPLEDIRKGLDQKWRNGLNRAERNGLEVIEGTDDRLFEEFIGLYQSMLERKGFPEPNNIHDFRRIQEDLPEDMKMRIFLSGTGGQISAGAVFSAIGETGAYLFGAINEEGMKNKGSYLIQWKGIDWLKRSGCRQYDLNGINPKANPGTYHFKAGIAGKQGRELDQLGSYDCYPSAFHAFLTALADTAIPILKRARF